MICKYCGADLQEGAATCASCGAAVEGVSAEVVTEEATEVVVPQKNTKAGKGLGIASLILGILLFHIQMFIKIWSCPIK